MPDLVDAGHTELAYDVLPSTDIPSWLYPISAGATTVWETWDAIKPDGSVSDVSQNHYAFGVIGEFRTLRCRTRHRPRAAATTVHEPRPDPAGRLTQAPTSKPRGPCRPADHQRRAAHCRRHHPGGATATITVGSTSTHVGAGTHQVSGPLHG